jgi:ribosomal protein S21
MAMLMVLSLQAGPFQIKIGEGKVRKSLRILKRDHRRATSALELLSRTDLEETLKLFKRILDELD